MADFSFFKELHNAELSRRDNLNASLSFPVGILTLVGGAIFGMLTKISPPFIGWKAVLGVMLIAVAACLVTSAIYLIKAYWGYKYMYLPLPDELLVHRNALVSYHLECNKSESVASKKGIADFQSDLEKTCAAYGRINALNNESKAARIFLANSFLIGGIAATIFCAPIYVGICYFEKKEPSKIEITNAKEFVVNKPTEPNPRPTTQETPKPPAPVRPAMPPGREIKEHVDPNKRK
jgi:hypothetical protein